MKKLLLIILLSLFPIAAHAAIDCDAAYLMTGSSGESDVCTADAAAQDLTAVGTVTQASTGPTGYDPYSRDFQGSDDYLYRTHSNGDEIDIDGSSSLTICVWFNPDSVGSAMSIVSKWHGDNYEQYLVQLGASGTVLLSNGRSDCTTNDNLSTTTTVSATTWNHFCAVVNGGGSRVIYLNGRYEDSDNWGASYTICDGSADFVIGGRDPDDGANDFDGKIGQVIISSEAATALEVFQIYSFGLGGDMALSGYEWARKYLHPITNWGSGTSPPNVVLVDPADLNNQKYIGPYAATWGYEGVIGAHPAECFDDNGRAFACVPYF